MKKIWFFLLLLLATPVFSQNLVPNPSFENFTSCPSLAGQIDSVIGWSSYRESPDYFNVCANSSQPGLGVPVNGRGSQYPIDGDAYMGVICFHFSVSNLREYAGIELIQPLIVGQKYFVSFFASLADTLGFNCPSNKLGVKFSMQKYYYNNPAPISNLAHVYTNNVISDKINWTPVSGTFIADSAYPYLMIGNFFDDPNTDTLNCAWHSFYYVEKICVSTDSLTCAVNTSLVDIVKGHTINIFPNPTNSVISIKASNTILSIEIYNSIGEIVLTKEIINSEQINLSVEHLCKGIYFCKILNNKNYFIKQIIIN